MKCPACPRDPIHPGGGTLRPLPPAQRSSLSQAVRSSASTSSAQKRTDGLNPPLGNLGRTRSRPRATASRWAAKPRPEYSPRKVCREDSIVEDVYSADVAQRKVAHRYAKGVPETQSGGSDGAAARRAADSPPPARAPASAARAPHPRSPPPPVPAAGGSSLPSGPPTAESSGQRPGGSHAPGAWAPPRTVRAPGTGTPGGPTQSAAELGREAGAPILLRKPARPRSGHHDTTSPSRTPASSPPRRPSLGSRSPRLLPTRAFNSSEPWAPLILRPPRRPHSHSWLSAHATCSPPLRSARRPALGTPEHRAAACTQVQCTSTRAIHIPQSVRADLRDDPIHCCLPPQTESPTRQGRPCALHSAGHLLHDEPTAAGTLLVLEFCLQWVPPCSHTETEHGRQGALHAGLCVPLLDPPPATLHVHLTFWPPWSLLAFPNHILRLQAR